MNHWIYFDREIKQKFFNIPSIGIHRFWMQLSWKPLVSDNCAFFYWIPRPWKPLYAKCGRDLKGPYYCSIALIWFILNFQNGISSSNQKSLLKFLVFWTQLIKAFNLIYNLSGFECNTWKPSLVRERETETTDITGRNKVKRN